MMWVAPIGLNCQCHRIELILTTKQSDQYREFADSGRVRSAGCAASQITFPGRQRLCYRLLLFPVSLLWTAIAWTVLYCVIHAYWIVRILMERRPVVLTPDEETLHRLAFGSLDRRKFARLAGLGR